MSVGPAPSLHDVEVTHSLRFPESFLALEGGGLLEYGTYGPAWQSEWLPGLLARPPFPLVAWDYEGLGAGEIRSELEDLTDPDNYRQVLLEDLLVPIGRNGAGDLYCFDLTDPAVRRGEVAAPVVLAWHDMNALEMQARSLEEFTFRKFPESAWHTDPGRLVSDPLSLRALLTTHRELLPGLWFGVVDDVLQRPVSADGTGQITEDEFRALFLQHAGWDVRQPRMRPYRAE